MMKAGAFVYSPNELTLDDIAGMFSNASLTDIRDKVVTKLMELKPTFRTSLVDMCYKLLVDENENLDDRFALLEVFDQAIAEHVQSDVVTLDDIASDKNKRVTFLQDGHPFAFNIDTVNDLQKDENPLTRKRLPESVKKAAMMGPERYYKMLNANLKKDDAERAAELFTLQQGTRRPRRFRLGQDIDASQL
jgi:hypothetical protein